jgi:hypothetical protein
MTTAAAKKKTTTTTTIKFHVHWIASLEVDVPKQRVAFARR